MSEKTMNFDSLVAVIEQTHTHFKQQAVKAVNVSLTVRNYLGSAQKIRNKADSRRSH
jgi:uncharacterized protein YqgV (UPF0045/DUF77 family)